LPAASRKKGAGAPVQTDLFSTAHSIAPDVWSIELGGDEYRFSLKRHPRARHVTLRAGDDGGLVVVVPRRMPLRDLDSIIRTRENWIRRNVSTGPDRHTAAPVADGSRLPYIGKDYTLSVIRTGAGTGGVELDGDRLTVRVPDDDADVLRATLRDWYTAEALRLFTEKTAEHSGGLAYGRVRVKDTRSRWGSCTPSGDLNFCWRLVAAPTGVIDYIVVHELMHLVRPDHSRAFWRLVEERCPEHHVHRKWLRENGRGLLRGL